MSEFSGKVALITGGTKGIGRATAETFVKRGAKVVVNYGSDTAAAESITKDLGAENCLAIQADAASLSGIDTMVSAAVEKFGKIDFLIPNAGRLPMTTVEKTTEADFDKTFALNVKGPYFLVQKAVPHMPPGSRIVLVSTTQDFASTVAPPYTLYCATKGAIDQMVRTFSKDLASKGINVNCVAPGPTGTDLFYEGKSEQILKFIASLSPYNRIGKPEEVAEAFAYLCGPGATWVNGQTIKVKGGAA